MSRIYFFFQYPQLTLHTGPHKHKKPFTVSKGRKVRCWKFDHPSHLTHHMSSTYSSSRLVVAESRAASRYREYLHKNYSRGVRRIPRFGLDVVVVLALCTMSWLHTLRYMHLSLHAYNDLGSSFNAKCKNVINIYNYTAYMEQINDVRSLMYCAPSTNLTSLT